MVESRDFTFSILTSNEKIAEHLEALARAFRKGDIELATGEEDLHLKPEGDIDMFLRAYRRGTRSKLTFDLKWTNHPDTMIELDIRSRGEDTHGE